MATKNENDDIVVVRTENTVASDKNNSSIGTPTRQSNEATTRVPSDINPSLSARSTGGRSGLGTESDILSTILKNAQGDVQSTINNAFTLSKEIETRANEVAEAAYEKDFEMAEAKVSIMKLIAYNLFFWCH